MAKERFDFGVCSMKMIVKYTFLAIVFVLVLPCGLAAWLVNRLFDSLLVFQFFSELFSLFPGLPGQWVRVCYYKQTLAEAHMDMVVAFGAKFSKMDARVGRTVTIASHTTVGCADIGDRAVIGNNVNLLSGRRQHNFVDPDINVMDGAASYSRMIIGSDVFIGDKSIIMANVGHKTIIGAGSIVVREIPPLCVAVGNPARVIKRRVKDGPVTEPRPQDKGSNPQQ
jgi:acetyltransferase-like isoleucine patch superfamily enzyme